MCGIEKPLDEFYENKRYRGGYTRRCKSCIAAAAVEWAASNPQRRRDIRLGWNSRNKDQKCESARSLRERNLADGGDDYRKSELERAARWRKENPEKVAATEKRARRKRIETKPHEERARGQRATARRRHRIEIADGVGVSGDDIKIAMKHQKGKCWWCGCRLEKDYHVDHRIALSKGGRHDPSNIVLACPKCNLRKNSKMPWEFCGRLL